MTVTSIQASQMLEALQKAQGGVEAAGASGELPFRELLGNLVQNVQETEAVVRSDMVSLAMGDMDALHKVLIDASKADLAVQTLVAVRNKALDAYNDIMRITL